MCWALLLDFPCCPFRFLKAQHLVWFLVNSVTINIMQSVCGRRRRRQLIKGFKQDGELIEWILVMVESLMCFRAFEEQCGCERKRKLINQTWTTTKLIWSKKKRIQSLLFEKDRLQERNQFFPWRLHCWYRELLVFLWEKIKFSETCYELVGWWWGCLLMCVSIVTLESTIFLSKRNKPSLCWLLGVRNVSKR